MKKIETSLSQIKIVFIVTTIFLIVLSFFVFLQIKKLIDSSDWVNHTNQVTMSLQNISSDVVEAETNQRAFLLSGDSVLLKKRDAAFSLMANEWNFLDSLLQDNPQQKENLKTLQKSIDAKKVSMHKVLQDYRPMDMIPAFRDRILDGVGIMDQVKMNIQKMGTVQSQILELRSQKYSRLSFLTPVFIIVLFLGALLILLVSYYRINQALHHSQYLQAKLEEEKTLAQTVLNSSPDNIIVLDKELRYLIANPQAEKLIFKYTKNYIGMKATELFPSTKTLSDMQKVLKGESIYHNDYYSKVTGIHYEVIYTPLYKGSEIVGLIARSRDISEVLTTNITLEKKNEELEERNTFVETLINSSVDLIMVVDEGMSYLKINKKAEESFGHFFPESIIGKRITEVSPNASTAEIKRAFEGITVYINKFKSFAFNKYYEVSYIPLKKKEEVHAVMIIMHDITESIEIEEEIRALNQTFNYAEQVSMFGSYRFNFATKKITFSDNLYRLLGCFPQEFEASVQNLIKYVHADDIQNTLNPITETFTLRHVSKREYRIIRSDTKTIYVRETAKTITDDEGVKWMIGTLQDITEEKHQEHNLSKTNEDLEKMNKELQAFAYISSHDLQEPLRKIQTFSTRIIEKELDHLSDSAKDNFERIQAAALRMQTLIQDLLAYSSTNSDERKFEYINLGKITDLVQDDLKDDLQQRNATIETNGMCEVKVIPFQFTQLLHNLIGNSLKFSTLDRAPHIIISAEIIKGSELNNIKVSAEMNYCHITVSDNGIGFEPEYNEKIFEVFQRLHGKEKYKGTGIGLAIVKKIVDNHNGQITANGEVNKGATFNIYIPLS
ncbi:MAG: PAS domain-containing protein [Bacteroidia bacterium]|nr:PAS domain-containing protein [Bacteroidia bacterium]